MNHLSASLVSLLLSSMTFAADPFVGTWKENVSKGSVPAGTEVRIYERLPDGTIRQSVSTFGGKPEIRIIRFDGKDYQNPTVPDMTYAWKQLNANTFEVMSKRDGKQIAKSVYELSSDGKLLTAKTERVTSRGFPRSATRIYARTAGEPNGLLGHWKMVSTQENEGETIKLEFLEDGSFRFASLDELASYTAKFDGKDYPFTGSPVLPNTTITLKRIDERTIEETWKNSGSPVEITTLWVSPDGQTMTMTHRDLDNPSAEPVIVVFEKQP